MPNIFIYGGCVVRDSYQLIKDQAGTSGYVARQSIISAANRPADVGLVELDSPFQTRMLRSDIESSFLHDLRRAAEKTDLLLMDFHVDRSGIYRLRNDAFLTPSQELTKSKIIQTRQDAVKIDLGTERHTQLWTNAAKRLVSKLEQFGLKEKTLIINSPWAEYDSSGNPFGSFNGRAVKEVSDHISSLTRILENMGLDRVTMPKEIAVAPVDHKWGSGPYHFSEEAMRWVGQKALGKLNC
ncbi:DUF6270 domain-containing protein [Glutamicibacter arilaitensis]|nr:DUF6270 domain-containing protein [Glutamicibacter arilaitensis]